MLMQALISSKMLNVFCVYPPTDDFVAATWKQIKEALWKYTYEGSLHGRSKIAENRITAPISKGGLGFITPQMAADTAYLGALKANLRHALLRPASTMNYLFQFTETKWNEVWNWGSVAIHASRG